MSKVFRISSSLALIAMAIPSLYADVTGTWHGHVLINKAEVMKKVPAAQKTMAESSIKEAQAMTFTLQFKKGGAYTSTITSKGQSVSSEGKWTSDGKTVSLQITKRNGQAAPANVPPQVFKLSSDQKTMTANQNAATITFKKG